MMWLMKILKIQLGEKFLIKYYVILAFNTAKNLKYDDINAGWLQWFIKFLMRRLQAEQLKMKVFLIKN